MAVIDAIAAVGTAIGGLSPGLIGAGVSLANGLMGSNASSNAAGGQVAASNRTADMQQGMYDQNQKNLQPYMQGGNVALSSLSGKLADGSLGGQFSNADFLANKDPGYQFQLDQGNQALQSSQAAGNGVLSGSALKGLINYNQGMASTGYQNAYQRWLGQQQNTYGQLNGVATLGENAAAGAGATGASYANTIGNTITGGANAAASGIVGSSNALSSGLSNGAGYMYLNSLGKNGMGGGGGFDSGFNGQNNPSNQAGLDNVINQFAG